MIRIEPTIKQHEYSMNLLDGITIGKRYDFNGDHFKQLFGITAQVIVCDFLGIDRPKSIKVFDGGVDLIWNDKTWDVKCEIRSCFFRPNKFVHNLSGHQIDYDVDGYIFLNYNRYQGVFELCGYILKENFKARAKYYGFGTNRLREDGTIMKVQGTKGLYELEDNALIKYPKQRRMRT